VVCYFCHNFLGGDKDWIHSLSHAKHMLCH
jgi:hypothetical protein